MFLTVFIIPRDSFLLERADPGGVENGGCCIPEFSGSIH